MWNPADVESLHKLWNSGGKISQDAFNKILELYDFRLGSPFLEAAIPANPLGMAYRLLQAVETDIRSWNIKNFLVLDTIRAEGRISNIDFSNLIQRIIGRHVNLRVLQVMADNIRKLITPTTVANGWGSPVGLACTKVEATVVVKEPVPVYPSLDELGDKGLEAKRLGADYDQTSGILRYENGYTEQIPPKAYVPGIVQESAMDEVISLEKQVRSKLGLVPSDTVEFNLDTRSVRIGEASGGQWVPLADLLNS